MGKAEATLRERIQGTLTPGRLTEALDALLAEHRAEVSAARDVALEEAARAFDRIAADSDGTMYARVVADHAARIRSLQSAPVAVVRKDEVREVLVDLGATIKVDERWTEGSRAEHRILNIIARRLGVDLDATGVQSAEPPPATCPVCGNDHYIRDPCDLPAPTCPTYACQQPPGHAGECDPLG